MMNNIERITKSIVIKLGSVNIYNGSIEDKSIVYVFSDNSDELKKLLELE